MNLNPIDFIIDTKNIRNARQLGGYQMTDSRFIKKNLLLRTGHLHNIDEEDRQILKHTYHLQYILDLRNSLEVAATPDLEVPGATIIFNPAFRVENANRSGADAIAVGLPHPDNRSLEEFYLSISPTFTEDLYIKLLEDDDFHISLRKTFDILLKAEGAVLFHCSAGKDRTGLTSAAILSVLGASKELIEDDFLLTNYFAQDYYELMLERAEKYDYELAHSDGFRRVCCVDLKVLDRALDHLDDKYGSFLNYLKNKINLTDEEIAKIKGKYLE
ncbi:MAG: tyrosine-protein phosphatase [Bacilli bacterium]|nr:tyrosine-protein phosphatase [Bacilli bacterium]